MTAPVLPLVDVTAPTVVPPRYGLYAAATVLAPGDGKWVNGVQYVTDTLAAGGGWSAECGYAFRTVTYTITVHFTGTRGGTDPDWTYTLTAAADALPAGVPARNLTINGQATTTGGAAVVLADAAAAPFTGTITVVDADTGQQTAADVVQQADGTTVAPESMQLWVTVPDPDVGPKTVDGAHGVAGTPFWVYDGIGCGPLTWEAGEQTARRRLEYSEEQNVEEAFWTGAIAGRALNNAPTIGDTVPVNTSPVGLVEGVAMLEQALAGYAGTGVIHAPRAVAAWAARYQQVAAQSGAVLRTQLGTPWAFGFGYPGPAGDAPHLVTLVATGAVVVRRGPVVVNRAFAAISNEVTAIAERPIVITAECVAEPDGDGDGCYVAVQVDMSKDVANA